MVFGNKEELVKMVYLGVIGFKVFMLEVGFEFDFLDDFILYEGMKKIVKLNKVFVLYVERNDLI